MLVIIPIILLIVIASYFIFHVRKLKLTKANKKLKYVLIVLAVVYAVVCLSVGRTVGKTFGLIIMFLFYCYLITDILNVVFKLVFRKGKVHTVWSSLYNSSILAFILGIVLIPVGYFTATNVVTTNYEIHSDKTFSQDKLNISMISDLHLGTTMDANELKTYCDEIESSNPDIVVLVGDIFDESTTKEDMEMASEVLGGIQSKYGIYYVYGNHDTSIYSSRAEFTKEDIYDNLIANNINILEDESTLIADEFYVIGRIDKSMDSERKSISEISGDMDKDKFILLLDHQPLNYDEAMENGVDLELSGHTHNGQIWPFGVFIDIFKTADLRYGQKTVEDFNGIVSSGIGGWGYPIKLGVKSEIVNIEVNFNN